VKAKKMHQIKISANGSDRFVAMGLNLKEILNVLDVNPQGKAVAVNMTFVPRSQHENTVIQDGDRLEIVSPMVGG
jgi:sulfur carrier protein